MVNAFEREASYLHRMLQLQGKYDFLWDYFLPQKRKFPLEKNLSPCCVSFPISTNKQEHFLTQLNVPATKLCVCNSTYCTLTIIKKYANHLCEPFIESSFTIFTVFVPHFCHLLWEMFSTLRDSLFLYPLHKHKTSIILLLLQGQNVRSAVFEPPTPQIYGRILLWQYCCYQLALWQPAKCRTWASCSRWYGTFTYIFLFPTTPALIMHLRNSGGRLTEMQI